MALDTTVGGAETESYNTTAEYHDYVSKLYNDDLSTNDENKDEANLRRAMQILDFSWDWKGHRPSFTQAAAFPRVIEDMVDGISISSTEIPIRIKHAQFEYAYLLHQNVDLTPTIEGGTIRSESVGAGPAKLSTEFDQIMQVPKVIKVENLIAPYHNGPLSGFGISEEVIRG